MSISIRMNDKELELIKNMRDLMGLLFQKS